MTVYAAMYGYADQESPPELLISLHHTLAGAKRATVQFMEPSGRWAKWRSFRRTSVTTPGLATVWGLARFPDPYFWVGVFRMELEP